MSTTGPQEHERWIPSSMLYGWIPQHDCLAVVDDMWARAARQELRAWQVAKTLGEARRLAAVASALGSPFDIQANEDLSDEEPFTLNGCGAVVDGDWPGMPTQRSLMVLPDDWPLGEETDTVFNGPYLDISVEDEDELVRLLTQRGCEVRRDDQLILELAMWP